MNPFIIFFSLFLHGGQRYPYHGSAACLLIFHFRPQSIQVSYRFSMRRAGERESDVLLLPAFPRFFLPLPHSLEICGFHSHSVLRGPGVPRSAGMFCTFCSMRHLLSFLTFLFPPFKVSLHGRVFKHPVDAADQRPAHGVRLVGRYGIGIYMYGFRCSCEYAFQRCTSFLVVFLSFASAP